MIERSPQHQERPMSLAGRIKRDTVILNCSAMRATARYSQGEGVTINVEMRDGKAVTTQSLNPGIGFNSLVRDGMLAKAYEAMQQAAALAAE